MLENVFLEDEHYGVSIVYDVVVKKFSNGTKNIKKTSYYNYLGRPVNNRHTGLYDEEKLELSKQRNLRRMKSLIYDIAYENGCISPWEYFVTLTFDDDKVNALNYDEVKKKLKNWLDQIRRKSRDMRYIIIAELHKSGRIHFHGLFCNVNWELVPAVNPHNNKKIFKNGSQIFNIKDFDLGFTTVSKIKDLNAVTFYITKYITKDLLDIRHKKHYWTSKNLVKPKKEYYKSFDDFDIYDYLDRNNDTIVNYNIKNTSDSSTEYFGTSHNIYSKE